MITTVYQENAGEIQIRRLLKVCPCDFFFMLKRIKKFICYVCTFDFESRMIIIISPYRNWGKTSVLKKLDC